MSALSTALLLVVPGLVSTAPLAQGAVPVGGGNPPHPAIHLPSGSVVGYKSSVDKFALSYLEWLPKGFVASHHYPLAVFFHGMGGLGRPVSGGVGATSVPLGIVQNATQMGVILISLNTRTAAGFFTDTPCGGPQGQDVLDAIAHERLRRNISETFAIGFSMGTVGVLSLAASQPGLFQGIALAAPLTDLFEEWAFEGGIPNLAFDFCHVAPGSRNTTVDHKMQFLSPARFAPKNFSGIPLYVTAGGQDTAAPNNFTIWPFAMVNSTFVNSSCQVATAFGEIAGCTTTFASLVQAQPGNFSYRYVYESDAPHSALQLPGADVFGFLLGRLAGGLFQADFPAVSVTVGPAPP